MSAYVRRRPSEVITFARILALKERYTKVCQSKKLPTTRKEQTAPGGTGMNEMKSGKNARIAIDEPVKYDQNSTSYPPSTCKRQWTGEHSDAQQDRNRVEELCLTKEGIVSRSISKGPAPHGR